MEPRSGDAKYTGVRKICNFRPKSPFILETARDRLTVTMDHQQKVLGSRAIARPKTTKFCTVSRGEGRISRGIPSVPHNSWDQIFYMIDHPPDLAKIIGDTNADAVCGN